MKTKYRYFMGGTFRGTDGNEYAIDIPSPNLYDSENEAMKDGSFGYRFVLIDESVGPQIAVFGKEEFSVDNKEGQTGLKVWVNGDLIKLYSFEEFKTAGGIIRMLKEEKKNSGFIIDEDFVKVDSTFNDIFPNIVGGKLYYIDNNAYCICPQETP